MRSTYSCNQTLCYKKKESEYENDKCQVTKKTVSTNGGIDADEPSGDCRWWSE